MPDLLIREDPSLYPVPDEGLHSAVLVDAVDLGSLETPWGTKHKVSLIFELEEETEDGKRFVVGKRFTKSLNEKSALRKFLEKWLGKKLTTEELREGVNLEDLVGLNANLFIVHNDTDDRTYANIESVLPYKDQKGKPNPYRLKASDQYTRVIHREDYKEPEEYSAMMNEAS